MTVHVCVLGTTVRLAGSPRGLDEMARLWEPFLVPGGPADGPEIRVTDPATASAALNRLAVAACPHPAVHAGVVALGRRAIAVPAASGEGKSTLVGALCRVGATYLSDEALVVGPDGLAVPYPKPLALAPESLAALGVAGDAAAAGQGPAGGEHLLAPHELGPVGTSPVPVGDVVLPMRDADDLQPARLEPIPRREAFRRLVELGFNHYRDPPGFLRATAAVVTAARAWSGRYREASDLATVLIDVLPEPVSSA